MRSSSVIKIVLTAAAAAAVISYTFALGGSQKVPDNLVVVHHTIKALDDKALEAYERCMLKTGRSGVCAGLAASIEWPAK